MPGDPPFALPDVLALLAPVFALLIAAEALWLLAQARGFDWRNAAASLATGAGSVLANMLTGAAVAAAYYGVYRYRLFDIPWAWWSMALCFAAEDFAHYWQHRLSHERRWLWASHIAHHTSEQFNLSTAFRQPWTSALGLAFVFWLPLAWIGFPPPMVFFFSAISFAYQFWLHTEAIGRLGLFEHVLNTPSHHRVHHAVNPGYLDANYGGVLILWDRIFGTFAGERAQEKPRYGLIGGSVSFNPVRIALREWAAIGRDLGDARRLRDALGYVVGPPGWRPDGARSTSQGRRADWAAAEGDAPP
ncbi:MAG: sterol desaturase family protein [Hyphomonadaceae bacterium]